MEENFIRLGSLFLHIFTLVLNLAMILSRAMSSSLALCLVQVSLNFIYPPL